MVNLNIVFIKPIIPLTDCKTGQIFSIWIHLPFRHAWLCIPSPCLRSSAKKWPLNSAQQQQSLKKHLSPDQEAKNWKHGHCNDQMRLMIGIDSKYLHKIVPFWRRHWHFHAEESCYSSSISLANVCTWLKWKVKFEKFPKIRNFPKFWKLQLLSLEWLKFVRFGNLTFIRHRLLVKIKMS